jgi:hypothetical protein
MRLLVIDASRLIPRSRILCGLGLDGRPSLLPRFLDALGLLGSSVIGEHVDLLLFD